MIRLISAGFLLVFSFASLFVAFYLPMLDIPRALYNALPFYAPLAGFALTASLAVKTSGGKRPWIINIFIYMLLATAGEFAVRELIAPFSLDAPLANPLPEDFVVNGHPDSKKGMMIASPGGIYLFGETIKTPAAFLGRNFTLISSNAVQHSALVRIEENRIIALNLRTVSQGATNASPGASPLQSPIDIATLYAVWGDKNPQNVPLLPALGKFEIFNNPLLEPYKKTLSLAFARYAGTFILLLLAAVLGLSAANTLDFKNIHALGTLAAAAFGIPGFCMGHYYIIEMINAAVNGLL